MVFINNYNEFLAQTRLRQGRDFDELSISSGVAVSHLKAIEKANTHPFYSRSYYERCVMKYASALGVDEEIVLEQPTQSELPLEAPPEPAPGRTTSGRLSLAEEDDGPPPLPAALFASRGPLVPPAPPQPAGADKAESKTESKPQAPADVAVSAPVAAKPVAVEAPAPHLTSLDEILPPKLDMTPPKAGFGFPVFLVSIGVALAAGVLLWQHLQDSPGPVAIAQQEEKPGSATVEAKPADQAAATATAAPAPAPVPVVVDETEKLRAEVERNLGMWAKNWADRDAAGHLAFFDNAFPEFSKYADNRRKRIAAATSIEVKISDVVIEKRGDGEFASRFVQAYRSDTLTSKDTKELIWKKTASGMKIVSERVLK